MFCVIFYKPSKSTRNSFKKILLFELWILVWLSQKYFFLNHKVCKKWKRRKKRTKATKAFATLFFWQEKKLPHERSVIENKHTSISCLGRKKWHFYIKNCEETTSRDAFALKRDMVNREMESICALNITRQLNSQTP